MLLLVASSASGADEWQPLPRRLPPPGIAILDAQRQELEAGLKHLEARLAEASRQGRNEDVLPDVEIFAKAVRFALAYDEFYRPQDFASAAKALAMGEQRLDALAHHEHPWTAQHGVLVRGYRSDIDGSAQPYGLEIPDNLDLSKPAPLYVWLHGRGDKETDLYFILQRASRHGQIAPSGAIVVHPFGRQCLGFKSAGEIDVLDAIASVKHRYKIDPNRVVLMGFSMGGAGAWHLGAHYADQFAAVHAGAGFVDVARYQKLTPDKYPAWYEQTLWGMYDVPDYVRNLFNLPTVGYGGQIDPQRESSKIMAEAFDAEGHHMTRIVGPGMGHKYDPGSLAEIMRLMADAARKGRDPLAKHLTLQTRTLRYNQMRWATITALAQHWKDSRLDADVIDDGPIRVATKNVTELHLANPLREPPASGHVQVEVDGTSITITFTEFRASGATFSKSEGSWKFIPSNATNPTRALQKRRGLQGPIDDAFMAPFLVVTPTGHCASPQVQKWVDFELAHQQDRWRAVFRGDLREKRDTDVTEDDMRNYHLVLWGDPQSNRLLARVAPQLPIRWGPKDIDANGQRFDGSSHVPVMIYPNPLNPERYVVLNSGPTFRENDDRTNSLQNPKLPDWAILDVTSQPTAREAGKVMAADFFDEQWKFKSR
jgi:acetyl esterase/lipase